jgi:hypothetical protein
MSNHGRFERSVWMWLRTRLGLVVSQMADPPKSAGIPTRTGLSSIHKGQDPRRPKRPVKSAWLPTWT